MEDFDDKKYVNEMAIDVVTSMFNKASDERMEVSAHALLLRNGAAPIYVPALFDDDEKQHFANKLRELVNEVGARSVVFVAEAWMSADAASDESISPSQSPDRKECLLIQVETWKSQDVDVHIAEISGSGTGRTISDFVSSTAGGFGTFGAGFLPVSRFGNVGVA